MKRCPIIYELISKDENYSKKGLRLLASQLKNIESLTLTAEEQRQEALARIGKMSIQGVQPKLSAVLKVKEGRFDIVSQKGRYILKPQNSLYPELPENEAITMSLADIVDIDVPIHGLVHGKDDSMTYFIKRFDRTGHTGRVPVEDFSQLLGLTRDTKYKGSMEKVINVIEKFCSFPTIEFVKLLRLTLFNYLIGNEDMHLKNFSLITRENITMLSPAYDLLNTTIAQKNTKEEIALPLNGKKSNLTQRDFFKYFAFEKMRLNEKVIKRIVNDFKLAIPRWEMLIQVSFLSDEMKEKYIHLLSKRSAILPSE